MNLLIDIGYFPVHVNLELMKLNVATKYSEEILLAADEVLLLQPDPDKVASEDSSCRGLTRYRSSIMCLFLSDDPERSYVLESLCN